MKGLDIYKTKTGFTVARVHYSADIDKDPDRDGKVWFENAMRGFRGGVTGPAWRKEMEIDFTAYSGELFVADLMHTYRQKIIVNKEISYCNLYAGFDYGSHNPFSFHVYAVDKDKNIHSVYELYGGGFSVSQQASMIKECPYFKQLIWMAADPALWIMNQETRNGLRSLYDLFCDEGVIFMKGSSRSDNVAIAEVVDRWANLNDKQARFTISPACHNQFREFMGLRYQELTTAMFEKANPSEALVDKDNHSWDDFKYFISTWLSAGIEKAQPKIHPDSVAAWMAEEETEAADRWKNQFRGR